MTSSEPAFSEAQIRDHLKNLGGWSYEGGAIRRTYQTDGWRGSMLVANAIAFICEAADHHADLAVSWPRVGVALSTHSAGGVTAKDFEVAERIESSILWTPPVGSALRGPTKPFVRA